MNKKIILDATEIDIILHRLACQLIENHGDLCNTVLIGIQPRGAKVLNRLVQIIKKEFKLTNLQTGLLDITFYRDDFRRRDTPLKANTTSIDTVLENKRIVLVDDVLYTGRSIRAALTAIESYGRPDDIELAVLIDRRFSRNLPIQPTYKGKQVDSFNNEKISVSWSETGDKDTIYVIQKPTETT